VKRLDPEIIGEHLDRLLRTARALCDSHESAEDLVQETVATVISRPRLVRGENELAYLKQALRNTFVSSMRTAARRPGYTALADEWRASLIPSDSQAGDRRQPRCLAGPSRGLGRGVGLEQVLFELVAGFDPELAERFAEVVVHGAGADEQLGRDLLIGRTVGREATDLGFLRRQVIARLDSPFPGVLAGRLELDPRTLRERFHAELREQLMGGA
jgi:DNA-directed RNA polymerase specialized sigma24 family protein